jgi:hypothetical protein
MNTQAEQIKLIALRFAQEGWGTNPNWQETWDELMSHDVVHHFNSSPEPIVGLEANKAFNASLFQGFPDIHRGLSHNDPRNPYRRISGHATHGKMCQNQ